MKYPKGATTYWDEGQVCRKTNKHTQLVKRYCLFEWYKKGFWKRYFRKVAQKNSASTQT